MSFEIAPHKWATIENLPPELIGPIIHDLPLQSLATLRLCWPHLNCLILPRLFHKIHVTFAERHLARIHRVASSSHIAPHVQELVWITSQTRETHDDNDGHVHTDHDHELHAREARRIFLACIDALPNLHILTSELGPICSSTQKEDINGLVYAIMPALCRPSSRITSLRLQDPLNYIRWFRTRFEAADEAPPATFKSLPEKYTMKRGWSCMLPHGIFSYKFKFRVLRVGEREKGPYHHFPYEWTTALRGLLKLDLQADTAGGAWQCYEPSGKSFALFLQEAVNLREISVRWRRTGHGSLPGRPLEHSGWQLEHLFNVQWDHLRTIKLTFVQLTFQGKPFRKFIDRHAATLRHILLYNCRGGLEVAQIIKHAARNPDIKLHRFAVFPAYENHTEEEKPRIIPEKLVLGYINSKDPLQNPFASWKPSGSEYWGTVDQKAESLSVKWPEGNGMPFVCRKCIND
ncbi:hypothetical protein FSARC_10707 [Fusarium sarcochroum]|uniref:F-box domain-containing protein n=1 Tax=Fusarium sarcochroum TaxID=1208366 RepID=A0A8H4TKQ0_9HYPO|nr:hypothetical protein FSARC_10707 [Fusarium sarcochroum]